MGRSDGPEALSAVKPPMGGIVYTFRWLILPMPQDFFFKTEKVSTSGFIPLSTIS
jgi:hypothetical protein